MVCFTPPWLVCVLWPFLDAPDYANMMISGFCKEQHACERTWLKLARRDFAYVDWRGLASRATYKRPVSFYRFADGQRTCALCGEQLWTRGQTCAAILLCSCLRIYAYPYVHSECIESSCEITRKHRKACTVTCPFCTRHASFVEIRVYS